MVRTSMNICMDLHVRKRAQQFFSDLGMDTTTAVNLFLHQVIRHNGLPFELKLETSNAPTLVAMAEGERLLEDPNTRRFSSGEELFKDLDS